MSIKEVKLMIRKFEAISSLDVAPGKACKCDRDCGGSCMLNHANHVLFKDSYKLFN